MLSPMLTCAFNGFSVKGVVFGNPVAEMLKSVIVCRAELNTKDPVTVHVGDGGIPGSPERALAFTSHVIVAALAGVVMESKANSAAAKILVNMASSM